MSLTWDHVLNSNALCVCQFEWTLLDQYLCTSICVDWTTIECTPVTFYRSYWFIQLVLFIMYCPVISKLYDIRLYSDDRTWPSLRIYTRVWCLLVPLLCYVLISCELTTCCFNDNIITKQCVLIMFFNINGLTWS